MARGLRIMTEKNRLKPEFSLPRRHLDTSGAREAWSKRDSPGGRGEGGLSISVHPTQKAHINE